MLSLIISIPLLGALLLTVIRCDKVVKIITLLFSSMAFIVNIILLYKFDFNVISENWLGFKFRVDGLSLMMLLLTTFLFPICIIVSFQQIYDKSIRLLMMAFLILESLIIGVFLATDIIMFYMFFEATLIPMFFIIGVGGHHDRVYAAFKLFLYTLVGSVVFLISLIYMYVVSGGVIDIDELSSFISQLGLAPQCLLWCGCFIAFAIKLPTIPFHTWLPDAHVQAPTGGSMILAGILIKIGGYGFLKIMLPMLPKASIYFSDFMIILSAIAVIYASMVAFAQKNIKKLIAYSSVAHMGFVTAGIFSLNEYGISGAIFQMISHGLISSALFLCVGILYNKEHTFEISHYSGLMKVMPLFSIIFMILSLSSIGVPGTSGFIGEFLTILGTFDGNSTRILVTFFMACGIVMGAIYMLFLCKKVIWGITPEFLIIKDLNKVEFLILSVLVILILFIGFYPNWILNLYLKPVIIKLMTNNFYFLT